VATPVIGLEIHVRLRTRTKLFCGCPNRTDLPPGDAVCPVCLGLPGTLPVPGREAVRLAARLARALGATVAAASRFERKQYFYPDLPRNYQITQQEEPLASGGEIVVGPPSRQRRVRVRRLHLEEDAARLVHGRDGTLVDPNRAGAPLVEIVTEPDLRDGREAAACVRRLRQLVRELGVGDGDLERGTMRCDANVSLRGDDGRPAGGRVELKNLNSLRGIARAVAAEISRQRDLLARGEPIVDQTRGWDERRGVTVFLRGKEEAPDYRYLPEPDLPPLVLDGALLAEGPPPGWEPPHAREARLAGLGLDDETATVLADSPTLTGLFDAAAAACGDPLLAARWLRGEWTAAAVSRGCDPAALPVDGEVLGRLLRLLSRGELTRQAARRVFDVLVDEGGDPAGIAARLGLLGASVADDEVDRVVAETVAAHPEQAAAWRAGKTGLLEFFVGRTLARLEGRGDPRRLRELLTAALSGEVPPTHQESDG